MSNNKELPTLKELRAEYARPFKRKARIQLAAGFLLVASGATSCSQVDENKSYQSDSTKKNTQRMSRQHTPASSALAFLGFLGCAVGGYTAFRYIPNAEKADEYIEGYKDHKFSSKSYRP